jgi:hypothetical protein
METSERRNPLVGGQPAAAWKARWEELTPAYEAVGAS